MGGATLWFVEYFSRCQNFEGEKELIVDWMKQEQKVHEKWKERGWRRVETGKRPPADAERKRELSLFLFLTCFPCSFSLPNLASHAQQRRPNKDPACFDRRCDGEWGVATGMLTGVAGETPQLGKMHSMLNALPAHQAPPLKFAEENRKGRPIQNY